MWAEPFTSLLWTSHCMNLFPNLPGPPRFLRVLSNRYKSRSPRFAVVASSTTLAPAALLLLRYSVSDSLQFRRSNGSNRMECRIWSVQSLQNFVPSLRDSSTLKLTERRISHEQQAGRGRRALVSRDFQSRPQEYYPFRRRHTAVHVAPRFRWAGATRSHYWTDRLTDWLRCHWQPSRPAKKVINGTDDISDGPRASFKSSCRSAGSVRRPRSSNRAGTSPE